MMNGTGEDMNRYHYHQPSCWFFHDACVAASRVMAQSVWCRFNFPGCSSPVKFGDWFLAGRRASNLSTGDMLVAFSLLYSKLILALLINWVAHDDMHQGQTRVKDHLSNLWVAKLGTALSVPTWCIITISYEPYKLHHGSWWFVVTHKAWNGA